MPNLVALTSEYAPQKMRSTLVTTMFSGYAVGGVMAALLGVIVYSKFWLANYVLYCRYSFVVITCYLEVFARVFDFYCATNRQAEST